MDASKGILKPNISLSIDRLSDVWLNAESIWNSGNSGPNKVFPILPRTDSVDSNPYFEILIKKEKKIIMKRASQEW